MAATVSVTDRRARVSRAYREASRLAMDAAANVYEREVKRAHNDHYTSQAFRGTLQVRQSIRRAQPEMTREGWVQRIGTKLRQPLYWELGHMNLFTRRFERRELWKPTAIAQAQAIRNAYARVLKRLLEREP